jgi:alpha-amylase
MPSVCFYFQLHQPYRLRQYSFFDIGRDHHYENDELNIGILHKVADKCYIPANQTMLELIKKHKKNFRISYSVSGVLLEQLEKYRPDVIESFRALAKTGCVEFLAETYYHSLCFLYSKDEFKRQVELHTAKIEKLFKYTPTVFRNTELIYSNELANTVQKMGFKGILSEGVEWILNGRSPHFVYNPPSNKRIKVLLRDYTLSDDIAFRFSNTSWTEHPLTAQKFAKWVHSYSSASDCINLFMDYETFGEHQWEGSGIFEFLKHLPEEILKKDGFDFKTPAEVINDNTAKGVFDVLHNISWADTERDLSAWLSNSMQSEALSKLYALEDLVKKTGDHNLLEKWSRLQISDHFYYMCTKHWNDGEVHKYFSPFNSPYDSYIYFINALSDLEIIVKKAVDNMPAPVKQKPPVKKTAEKKVVEKKAAEKKEETPKKKKENKMSAVKATPAAVKP